MNYRKFGKTGFNASALGFGAMRLPLIAGSSDDKDIDEKEAIRIIRRAIDGGVNYIDSAYFYHGGLSEVLVGKALKDGYRKKVKTATKSPVGGAVKNGADFDRVLDEQLKRMDDTHIDFYMFHGLGTAGWDGVVKEGLLKKMEEAKKKGKIGHIGFSFHDNNEAFTRIIDGYNWDFCQIQHNYMDTENQAGTKGLQYAGSKGIAVIIMEGLLGGRLARPPKDVKEMIEKHAKGITPAEWALQWLWTQPEVSMVLSGMTTGQQVEDNLVYASRSGHGVLDAAEVKFVESVRDKFNARKTIPCTKCKYCMPCPHGVNIPNNFSMYNEGLVYDDPGAPRFTYNRWTPEPEKADKCTQCKECEEKCPQKIEISAWMPKVHAVLGEGKEY